jgi:site-specific DNA-cytosine methylase
VRCLELFAGAGGAALGLERAGIHHAALVEWQPSACSTLRAAGLSPVVEGDVRALDAIEAVAGRDVDLVWSSFPCQAWSTAGKRLGAMDSRNGWPATVAAVDRFRPRWFLGENVTGLLCHKGGCTYRGGQEGLFAAADPNACPGCYLERVILPDIRARFACAGWWVIDAADHGTPQHRRRVILWAGPVEPERPRETHGPGRPLPWVAMADALGLVGEEGATTCGGFGESRKELSVEGPSTTVTCQLAKQANLWKSVSLPYVRVIGAGTNPHGPGRAHERTERDITDEPSTTITAEQVGNAGPWIAMKTGSWEDGKPAIPVDGPSPTISASYGERGRTPWTSAGCPYLDSPAPTVTTTEEKGTRASAASGFTFNGGPDRASDALFMGTGRRRLTYLECATLQGFPADHPWQGTITERYRQVGNAVVPLVAELLGRAIIEADRVNP